MSRQKSSPEKLWQSAIDRFPSFLFCDPNSSCWLWTGNCKVQYGKPTYGCISVGARTTYPAHRFSWEIHNGPVPAGLSVLHKCDVRSCVNPSHLFLGTQKDNMRDAWNKGRGTHPDCNGEKAEWAKLTATDVMAIRAYQPAKWGDFTVLAKHYGISPATLCDIRNRRTWRSVA